MNSTHTSGETQNQTLRFWSNEWCLQVLGLLLGPGLVYAYVIAVSAGYLSERWLKFQTHGYLSGYLLWLAFHAGFLCVWLWLVLRFVCNEQLTSLNRRPGNWRTDLLHGFTLALLSYIVLYFLEGVLRYHFHTGDTSAVHRMTKAAVSTPLNFYLQLGPTIWLANAIPQEFIRVMLLNRLWKLGSSRLYLLASIGLAAVLFALCHVYQGTTGFISTIAAGVILSLYYLVYGRPLALIFSHGLFDTYILLHSMAHSVTAHGQALK